MVRSDQVTINGDAIAEEPISQPMSGAETFPEQTGSAEELSDFIEAAGLLSYDPQTIARIYAGHPRRLLRRVWQTLVPISLFLIGVGFDKVLGLLSNEERARQRAQECAELLAALGPAFIKAGQALSTRPDIIPPLLLEELAQLQDQLPGFDSTLAMACIEEDLGAPVTSLFLQLDREPISAASLGQVHRGYCSAVRRWRSRCSARDCGSRSPSISTSCA